MRGRGYVTPREAASLVMSPLTAIYRLAREDKITTQRLGQFWFVELSSLKRHYHDAPLVQERIDKAIEKGRGAGKVKRAS